MKSPWHYGAATLGALGRFATMNSRIVVSIAGAALLLGGCDDGGSPLLAEPLRPGADRQIADSTRLPAGQPPPAGYDTAVVPEDSTLDAKVGSVVAAAGGQQAQKAREEKEIAGIKRRWAREKAGKMGTEGTDASLPPTPQSPKAD